MNKKQNPKERYEAPAVLDISPATVNVAAGESLDDPDATDPT